MGKHKVIDSANAYKDGDWQDDSKESPRFASRLKKILFHIFLLYYYEWKFLNWVAHWSGRSCFGLSVDMGHSDGISIKLWLLSQSLCQVYAWLYSSDINCYISLGSESTITSHSVVLIIWLFCIAMKILSIHHQFFYLDERKRRTGRLETLISPIGHTGDRKPPSVSK